MVQNKINFLSMQTSLLKITLKKMYSNFRVKGETSDDFEIRMGLRQGGPPRSILLFNLVIEKIMRDSEVNMSGNIMYKSHQGNGRRFTTNHGSSIYDGIAN